VVGGVELLRCFPDLALAVPADEIVWRPSYVFRFRSACR
jgi:hypothetical protein